jgi:hypothetical protein
MVRWRRPRTRLHGNVGTPQADAPLTIERFNLSVSGGPNGRVAMECAMKKDFASWTASMLLVFLCVLGLGWVAFAGDSAGQVVGAADYKALPKPGAKVPLGPDGGYFVYGFAEAPKLGTATMRVEIFTRDGRQDTTFAVKGDVDMPSMRGAHKTGDKAFSLSAKGVYLLPVPIVMPGEWEFRFTFEKDGKTVLRGAYLFQV